MRVSLAPRAGPHPSAARDTSSGSSSASGSSAKRRSCRRGCGTVRPGSSTRLVAVEQQVEVDRPRAPALAALAAELPLDREQASSSSPRRELGLERARRR